MSKAGTVTNDDGIRLRTRTWAVDDARGQVVIVHGLAEHSGRWEHVGARLAEAGLHTVAYDWRGHGESGGDRGDFESFDHMLDDLECVFTRLDRHRPRFIYGHSTGGLFAAGYATTDRPQPDGYVLSAPALDANVPAAKRAAARVLGRVAPKLRLSSPVKAEQLSSDPAVGEAYFADPLLQFPQTTRSGLALLEAMTWTKSRLDRITIPTLVIHGADDELVPPEASAPLAGVSVCRRTLYSGYRHELHNEPDGAAVIDDVIDWIDGVIAG